MCVPPVSWIWRGGLHNEGMSAPWYSMQRLLRATGYSWAGLRAAWLGEPAFRLEVILLTPLVPVALWLGGSGLERAFLIGSLVLVLIVEMLNSAIEAVVDRVGSERHELSARAKDMGSAAVFIALVNVLAVWLLILVD